MASDMTAREALRKARATMRCNDNPGVSDDCESGFLDITEIPHPSVFGDQHRCSASALLDGFSVPEVTNAGG